MAKAAAWTARSTVFAGSSATNMNIEFQFGFCKSVADAVDAAHEVRQSCAHTDPPIVEAGGIVERPQYSMVSFYERNIVGEKCFVARVSGTAAEVKRTIELV